MNGYVCFYNQKRAEVHAETTLEARNKAQEIFKVKANKAYLISVTLAEKDGKVVEQSTAL